MYNTILEKKCKLIYESKNRGLLPEISTEGELTVVGEMDLHSVFMSCLELSETLWFVFIFNCVSY